MVGGVRLHYAEAGAGPVVLLLHGFPEFWYGWRFQIPALAAAGFRAVAVDLRGYNLSDKPAGVAAYRLENLTADIDGLVRHFGVERARVVGHDWGGAIAWVLAMQKPSWLDRVGILNAPHPALFRRELRRPRQLLRSWYMFFFQLPWLPEFVMRRRRFALLRRAFRDARPGRVTEQDLGFYEAAWCRPGALTAAVNYYRAGFRSRFKPCVIDVPALVIWGERDRYLGTGFLRGLEARVPQVRIERLPEASHWVQVDEAERVNELLAEFLRQPVS
jgi:pimeloyl-ACP methyl ester carboxylesterase